jgi:hypothetical protein
MSAFTHAFEPATNKQGQSLGVFKDFEVLEGKSPVLDRKTKQPILDSEGNPLMRDWSFVSLVFDVKGRIAGHTREIKLTTNGQFGTSGELEKAIKDMGWVNNLRNVVLDEDGLEIEKFGELEIDEDGLEISTIDVEKELFNSFRAFVEDVKGHKFWVKVTRDNKGYLRIEPGSITPKV